MTELELPTLSESERLYPHLALLYRVVVLDEVKFLQEESLVESYLDRYGEKLSPEDRNLVMDNVSDNPPPRLAEWLGAIKDDCERKPLKW